MQTWWLCWFCTEVSIPESVDGRHGGCVVLHRSFNSREC